MTFTLGEKSLKELEGDHEDLVHVVKRAIMLTTQDFSVHDGIRTAQEQNALFLKGASKLDGYKKISRHQTGHAVDLVPYVNSKLRWENELCFPIIEAVRKAAWEYSVVIRWGGTWKRITDDGDRGLTIKQMYLRSPAWDLVHIELPESHYPAD
jgi:peptidoglycan L-alanyl-D-glutamate endopeptidase CwlK